MVGLRYHVASLAAVFVALAVGILLGVAVSGKLSDAEESIEQREREKLQQDLEDAQAALGSADSRRKAAEELVENAYPALIDRRLEDESFAVVFLGPVDGGVRSAVERTLADADSGGAVRLVALDFPVRALELQNTLRGNEVLASFAGEAGDFGELGRELGEELVDGGEAPVWSALGAELIEERFGTSELEIDGVVVMASWQPTADDSDEAVERARATQTLADGIVDGLESSGLPVVGVATTSQPQSLTELYREQGISSVDNLDSLTGRLALALLLAQGEPGQYGIKDSAADGVLPPIEPLPPPE
ncbi:MAG: copper transporter [Gaiellaceae bacterium]